MNLHQFRFVQEAVRQKLNLTETANELAWEPSDSPDYIEKYANGLVVRAEDVDDPAIRTLSELLRSDEVREYIEQTWQGVVYPVGDRE